MEESKDELVNCLACGKKCKLGNSVRAHINKKKSCLQFYNSNPGSYDALIQKCEKLTKASKKLYDHNYFQKNKGLKVSDFV